MKRAAALVAIVAALSCAGRSERELHRAFDEAELALRKGELSKALDISARSQHASEQQARPGWAWKFRLLRGNVLLALADAPAASQFLNGPLPGGSEFDALRAQQKYLQAKAQLQDGALEQAQTTLTEARRLAPSALDLQLEADILSGQIELRLGKWSEAELRLNAVVDRATRAGDRYRMALGLVNLGMGRLVRGRYDEALSWFERVLSLADLHELTVYAIAQYNAGICYARLGMFDKAVEVQRHAVATQEKRGPSVRLQEALGSLGNTYFLSGDAKGSIPHLQHALNIATKLNLRSEAARWARNLAGAYARLEAWDEAERFNNEARRLEHSETGGTQPHFELHAADIAVGRGEFDKAAVLFERARTARDATPAVRWNAHFGLAGVALAAKQPERAARHFEAALEIIETTRSSLLKTEFKLSFLAQLIDFYHAYVDALIDQGQVDRALEIAESSRGRVLAERQGVQVGATSSATAFRRVARQSGAVLLSYWLAPTRSHVWVVSAGGIRVMALPPAADIETLVRDHQAMLGNTLADPLTTNNPPGSRLYELLIAPVSKWIPAGSQVVVVPDGALHRLNFETLPVHGVRPHYWIEDVEIQVAPSLTMLSREPRPAVVNRSLLLIGDPLPRAPEFPALRYASDEMNSIERHFGAAHVDTYRGARAAPSAFRDGTPGRFGVIHFTAHALANPESPLDSAVILSGPDHAFKLYARDVADQKLNADLVTVSACRSAGERSYSGEGLVGFAWAFLRAGSRRVIAGLWDVDDRSTAELMSAVYGSIAKGVPPPRALREAKLAFLRDQRTYAKPYYWGAFQVFTVTL
jgi:CHAT domain-containing protein/tetratricopeptide (TPR) repeat protein